MTCSSSDGRTGLRRAGLRRTGAPDRRGSLRRRGSALGIALALAAACAGGVFDLPRQALADDPPKAPNPPGQPAPPPPAAPAGDPAAGKDGAAPVVLVALSDADAAPLLDALKKAVKSRTSADALPALEALAGKTHKDLEPALAKLLVHTSVDVAAKAARCMGERAGPKTPAALWRAWFLPVNDKRWDVKAALLEALAATKAPLDAKGWDEVEGVWRQVPNTEAMVAIARYFTLLKTDKRPCKMFALWLDEPRAGSVNAANNPPASYWEARWRIWSKVKPAVVDALKVITGQTFDTSEEAKAWFKKNPKFGVDW